MAAAETTGMPWATWCTYFLPIPSPDAPPFGLGLPPAGGALGHLRDRLLSPVLFGIYNRQTPELDAVRTELGAPPVRRIERAMLRAPLMLYMTSEPFEYPRSDWPPSVCMVGPGIWDPPAKAPEWLEEISRPLVLVTCSTEFQNDGKRWVVSSGPRRERPRAHRGTVSLLPLPRCLRGADVRSRCLLLALRIRTIEAGPGRLVVEDVGRVPRRRLVPGLLVAPRQYAHPHRQRFAGTPLHRVWLSRHPDGVRRNPGLLAPDDAQARRGRCQSRRRNAQRVR
jgi:hypothetical protein